MSDSLKNENKLLKQEVEELKQQLEDYKKSLKQKDKYYQQIIDSVGAHIYWKDLEGRILGINKKNLTSLGLSLNDVIGKTDNELPVGQSFSRNIMSNDLRVIKNGEHLIFEESYLVDGKNIGEFLSTKSPLIDKNGDVTGVIGVSIDITDRKQMQNKIEQQNKELDLLYENQQVLFQQIIDCIDANIYWKDKDGRFLGINKKQLSVLKGLSYKDLVGKLSSEIEQSAEFGEHIYKNDLQVIKSGKSISFEEEYIVDSDKTKGTYFATKSPLKNEFGEIIGLVGVSIDITDRKKLEQEIKQKNKELSQKDAVKTQFIENFSHDIKVPINALVGRTQLLKLIGQKEKNEKFIEVATDTENSAMVLDTLFKQMQNIIIHEQFDNKIYNTTFNLFSLIDKEIEITKASIPNYKSINIDFYPKEDELSIRVNTDYYKLSQIIRNLLSNAIKYTDEGNINIEAEIIRNTDNKISFKFIVADTGIGIDKAHQDNIFELFNRAGITSHNNNRHGMGIGLYIVKNNVNILGGSISFESYLGQGSKFFISIPLETV